MYTIGLRSFGTDHQCTACTIHVHAMYVDKSIAVLRFAAECPLISQIFNSWQGQLGKRALTEARFFGGFSRSIILLLMLLIETRYYIEHNNIFLIKRKMIPG